MGTTLVSALWLDDKLAIANVGDSRLYVYRNGRLEQQTTDHSFVQEQIARGFLKPEDAEKSDLRNMLTRSVGVSEDVDVDLFEISVGPDDVILLCSDGLTKMLDDDQIFAVMKSLSEPEKLVDELIKRANEAGGGDNITVIIARLEKAPSGWGSLSERVKGMFKKKVESR
jgi:PPM family protein phosphatase